MQKLIVGGLLAIGMAMVVLMPSANACEGSCKKPETAQPAPAPAPAPAE